MNKIPEKIGRYEIRNKLGEGGMAIVYLAYDPNFARQVAIKVLKQNLQNDLQQRFNDEAKTIATLEHPAIVPVYDSGEHDSQMYMVMRYIEGETLQDRINRQEKFSLDEVLRILRVIAPAIDFVHLKGIVHRDLKPSNILIDNDKAPYISDFGIAKNFNLKEKITSSGQFMGTWIYSSPEQINGVVKLDGRSDIFSLGVVVFCMLVGETPFKNVGEIINGSVPVEKLSDKLHEIFSKVLNKEPQKRYITAVEFFHHLENSYKGPFTVPPFETEVTPIVENPEGNSEFPDDDNTIPVVAFPIGGSEPTPTTPEANPTLDTKLLWLFGGILIIFLIILYVFKSGIIDEKPTPVPSLSPTTSMVVSTKSEPAILSDPTSTSTISPTPTSTSSLTPTSTQTSTLALPSSNTPSPFPSASRVITFTSTIRPTRENTSVPPTNTQRPPDTAIPPTPTNTSIPKPTIPSPPTQTPAPTIPLPASSTPTQL